MKRESLVKREIIGWCEYLASFAPSCGRTRDIRVAFVSKVEAAATAVLGRD